MLERSVPVWLVLLLAILGLCAMVVFGWLVRDTLAGKGRSGAIGETAVQIALFPTQVYQALDQVSGYVTGDFRDSWLTVAQSRSLDPAGFTPVVAPPEIGLDGLMLRRDPAAGTSQPLPGWRLISGAFALDGNVENAVLLLAPDLQVVRVWRVDEIVPEGTEGLPPQPDYRKFIHGLDILPDGGLIVAMDGGVTLQRFGPCGKREWAIRGRYSHAVNLTAGAETAWVVRGNDLVEVEVADGAVRRVITPKAIMQANREIDILGLRLAHANAETANPRNTAGTWLNDPIHYNDVEPLSPALAAAFPDFAVGDLLISARSLNLVFVLDPDTLKLKWWEIGRTLRQHDPDWQPNGTITVYDNRMSRDYSRIVALDPARSGSEAQVLFGGPQTEFYSRIRGKHQIMPDGGLGITSPQEGRVFELAPDADTPTLEIVNRKPGAPETAYLISELRWLAPETFLDGLPDCAALSN